MFVKKLSPLAQALRVASEMAIADDDDREDRHDMSPMNAIQQPSTPPTEEEELRANQLIEGTKIIQKFSISSLLSPFNSCLSLVNRHVFYIYI